jgi:hypothetical protein
MAEAAIGSCFKTLQAIGEFRRFVSRTWVDCDRLCERLDLFQNLVAALKTNPGLLSGTKRENELLIELDRVLKQSMQFMKEHTSRTSFKGFSDLSQRENFLMDLAKYNLVVAKLAKELSLADDIDYDKIREEDYLVSSISLRLYFAKSFLTLFVLFRMPEKAFNTQSN